MFALGELVRELNNPGEESVEGRVVAVYTLGYGMECDQEVYVQPKGTVDSDCQMKFLASDLMLADDQLEVNGEYGFNLVTS